MMCCFPLEQPQTRLRLFLSKKLSCWREQNKMLTVTKMVITTDYLVTRLKQKSLWNFENLRSRPFCDWESDKSTVKNKQNEGGRDLHLCQNCFLLHENKYLWAKITQRTGDFFNVCTKWVWVWRMMEYLWCGVNKTTTKQNNNNKRLLLSIQFHNISYIL